MTLRLYNTLARELQVFTPLDPPHVTMYVCGPTVYDVPHIGHARSAYIFDVLRRYLQYRNYQVTFVRNVTDVDDKIIEKARQELGTGDAGRGTSDLKTKCREVAERYLKSYHDALDQLGVSRPDSEPKATEHVIPDPRNVAATKKIDASMTGFISQLIAKNMAYPAGGDVYFSVRKLPNYGKLSNRSLDELKTGARVEPEEHKEDPLDFALWKAAKPDEPSWKSPWGPGRPGWHIECSVMSTAYLGDTFDIHGGGVDLVFPHHENELAQARALDKGFARFWIHNGLLTVNGEKMSKSRGNYVTVEQALKACGEEADTLKMFFLSAHYRSPIDYSPENVRAARQRFDDLDSFLLRVDAEQIRESISQSPSRLPTSKEILDLKDEFEQAMDDDLNTPKALAVLDELSTYGNRWVREYEHPPLEKVKRKKWDALPLKITQAADAILHFGQVLGLSFGRTPVTEMVKTLVQEREEARERGDFAAADQKRKLVEEQGYVIEDTRKGPLVRRKR